MVDAWAWECSSEGRTHETRALVRGQQRNVD
jgi:hypothetical protein